MVKRGKRKGKGRGKRERIKDIQPGKDKRGRLQ
jgi:hypothetical protein